MVFLSPSAAVSFIAVSKFPIMFSRSFNLVLFLSISYFSLYLALFFSLPFDSYLGYCCFLYTRFVFIRWRRRRQIIVSIIYHQVVYWGCAGCSWAICWDRRCRIAFWTTVCIASHHHHHLGCWILWQIHFLLWMVFRFLVNRKKAKLNLILVNVWQIFIHNIK